MANGYPVVPNIALEVGSLFNQIPVVSGLKYGLLLWEIKRICIKNSPYQFTQKTAFVLAVTIFTFYLLPNEGAVIDRCPVYSRKITSRFRNAVSGYKVALMILSSNPFLLKEKYILIYEN
jgi:hypothetical protein